MSDEISLGKYIRKLREQKALSLFELSEHSKVAYAHLSRIENESTIPSPETIVKIATAIDGDLTVMLQKANNLPRIILDRLMERDAVVRIQTLQRSIAGSDETPDYATAQSLAKVIEDSNLDNRDVAELQEAISDLLTLKPHARRAVVQLISVLSGDEGDGEPG
jgi:transcriptional regulator with XRE-family HTH domain